MKEARKCLKKEHGKIKKDFKESAKCMLKLKKNLIFSHKKRKNENFSPQVIQKEIGLCKEAVTKLQTSAITKIKLLNKLQNDKRRG